MIGLKNVLKKMTKDRNILCFMLLKDGKLSAGEIAGCFEMTQATVSYHLSKLKQADLIFENKYKNYIYYEINTSVFEEVMLWLSQFGGFKDET